MWDEAKAEHRGTFTAVNVCTGKERIQIINSQLRELKRKNNKAKLGRGRATRTKADVRGI